MARAAAMTTEDRQRISADIARESPRLRNFVRRRIADAADAEDVLQDVLVELVESYRLPRPIEDVGAWLFAVARNRIIDFFRRKRPQAISAMRRDDDVEDDFPPLEQLLPAADAGPEAAYVRTVLVEELAAALEELPPEQRDVFIANEIDGRSFRDLAGESGISINTLLARKRYAVLHLRARLQDIRDEFTQSGG